MTPAQLVMAVSIAMGVPVETVTQHDRARTGRLRPAITIDRDFGRSDACGVNAPPVTTRDAARLVAAALAYDPNQGFGRDRHTVRKSVLL